VSEFCHSNPAEYDNSSIDTTKFYVILENYKN